MRKYWFFFFFFLGQQVFGQVTIYVDSVPSSTPKDAAIFIAGNFNGWNPGDPHYKLKEESTGVYGISLQAEPEGTTIEFKFTRGSWEKVEKGASGEEIANRRFVYGNNDTLHLKIQRWADMSSGGGRGSTADSNVHILSKAFFMPQLNRYRRIWVYLPPDYHLTSKRYPVLYMHDGQNLFDDQTSFAGEWKVDETLNKLYSEGKTVPIVIGIDNGGVKRTDELTPWVNPKYGGGEGAQYARFITETLKPYVDSLYRTLPDRKNTGVMGSSLGGLISDYMAVKYQKVFGMAGVFSPSFWFSDSVWMFTRVHPATEKIRFYFLCGGDESAEMAPDMLAMKDSLAAAGFDSTAIITKVVPGGRHNEKLWRESFEQAWLWLSQQLPTAVAENRLPQKLLHLYPNPVKKVLHVDYRRGLGDDSLQIFNLAGKTVMEVDNVRPGNIRLPALRAGLYIVKVTTSQAVYVSRMVK
jgi:predicted alpha/beta superfamily hydrolase